MGVGAWFILNRFSLLFFTMFIVYSVMHRREDIFIEHSDNCWTNCGGSPLTNCDSIRVQKWSHTVGSHPRQSAVLVVYHALLWQCGNTEITCHAFYFDVPQWYVFGRERLSCYGCYDWWRCHFALTAIHVLNTRLLLAMEKFTNGIGI